MNIEKETLINFKKSFDNLIEEDDGKLHNRLLKLSSGYIGSYESLILISSNIFKDVDFAKDTQIEIDNEKILNLQRAGFDVFIRNCGMIDSLIFKSCNENEIKFYISFRASCIKVYHKRNVPNPTGQCGLNTMFTDGITDFLKDKQKQ
jgi:hypothetical protein